MAEDIGTAIDELHGRIEAAVEDATLAERQRCAAIVRRCHDAGILVARRTNLKVDWGEMVRLTAKNIVEEIERG